jgi:glutamyl-tRNA reductase
MVLGETQILGQVREAYEAAQRLGSVGPALNPLMQRAIAVGKQVMHETALAEGRTSVASVAVEYAKRIFDHFADKTVLCVGAGKMAGLVLQNLAALKPGKVVICNRDVAKAERLAGQFGGGAAEPFDRLAEHLVAADVVVTSTGAAQPIVTRKLFESLLRQRRYRPAFLIDIAVPRDVEASVGQLENVYLYNMDDLQRIVATTTRERQAAVDAARAIVNRQVEEFVVAHRARELGPTIDRLYKRYHAVAAEELNRTLGKLPNVTDAERAHLEELARRIVNKLLHDPVQTLRRGADLHGPAGQYLHALERLFQLADEDPEDKPRGDREPE